LIIRAYTDTLRQYLKVRKCFEVVRQNAIEPRKVEIAQVRVEYLRKYLQARQMALLVEHIRRFQLYNPPQEIQSGRATPSGHNLAEVRQLYFSASETDTALPGDAATLRLSAGAVKALSLP
jgi:hypothetical protein